MSGPSGAVYMIPRLQEGTVIWYVNRYKVSLNNNNKYGADYYIMDALPIPVFQESDFILKRVVVPCLCCSSILSLV